MVRCTSIAPSPRSRATARPSSHIRWRNPVSALSGSSAVIAAEQMKTRTLRSLHRSTMPRMRVQVGPLVLVVGLGAPADVVDAVGDDQHRRPVGEDVAVQPLEAPGGRVAAPAGVDEPDLAAGEPQQGVVLDDLAVGPRRRDAVAQEDDRVAVPQGVVGPPRTGGGGREDEEHDRGARPGHGTFLPRDDTGPAIRARRWAVDRGPDRPDNPRHEDNGTARPLHGARARTGRPSRPAPWGQR